MMNNLTFDECDSLIELIQMTNKDDLHKLETFFEVNFRDIFNKLDNISDVCRNENQERVTMIDIENVLNDDERNRSCT